VDNGALISTSCADSQREAWAAALCAGLRIVDVSRGDAGTALGRELSPERDAVVCFDRLDIGVTDALRAPADAGVRVLLSLSGIEAESALALFHRVGSGSLVYQYIAEGSLLADGAVGDEQVQTAALEFAAQADPDDAAAYLYAINVPEDDSAAALALPRVRACGAPVAVRRLRELEQANAELWTTNRELGRQLSELRVQLHGGVPPMSAARLGPVPAGSALARIAREQDAARAAAEEREHQLRLRIEHLEWELGERVRQLDAEIQRVGAERDANGHERDIALRELDGLRGRRAARAVLQLADLRRDVFRR
jgi:hypothetical protein